MTRTAYNYAKALYALSVSAAAVDEADRLLRETDSLKTVLDHPLVSKAEKEAVVQRIFPKEIQNFMKFLSSRRRTWEAADIFKAYREYAARQEGVLSAKLVYVTRPTDAQLNGICDFLKKQYGARSVQFQFAQDQTLGGGFILRAGDAEYDWSLAGRLRRLSQKLIRR